MINLRSSKKRSVRSLLLALSLIAICSNAFPQSSPIKLQQSDPEAVNMSREQLSRIDGVVNDAISKNSLPGAVVLVGRHGKIVWRKAYGNRALKPEVESMTVDTVFDMASLTKIVATSTSIMILIERGQLSLRDNVAKYIPEFAQNGKANVTIEHLLTHRAGFVPDDPISDYDNGPEAALKKIYALSPVNPPGSKFVYSDVGFIVLGELVRRISGKPLDEFARENIYTPLGMRETGFKPTNALKKRTAPTEERENTNASTGKRWMRGEVHDPRSYLLGGVAGHAGLFSTADDLAVFCQMILTGGTYNDKRIMSPLTVARMTSPRDYGDANIRGLGWDIQTSYSSNRGDLFPLGSFGHTGFTGTSIWVDPVTDTFVVFLSNRVHPDGKGDVTPLRNKVATIVAASIMDAPSFAADKPIPRNIRPVEIASVDTKVLTGIDILERDKFAALSGRRVGLITNHTGRDSEGRTTIDILFNAPGVKLVKLFSPEHGIRGVADEKVANSVDQKTGLPILSLYGDTRRPTAEMLADIDTLVYDIQDVGARFYTYISTLGITMEEAAKSHIRYVVLDRPNPINGNDVEGPVLDTDRLSFVGYFPMPVRHGMTIGELATLYNAENKINADLTVIKMEGWQRSQWFDTTGLNWINPSPNMRSLTEATLYPGIGLLETTNVSVGRGTDTPFEIIGAPWMDGRKLAAALNAAQIQGVRFVPTRFKPNASTFKDQECGGVQIIITNRATFRPLATGIQIAYQLHRLYASDWQIDKYINLLGSKTVFEALKDNVNADELAALWSKQLSDFEQKRAKYLIY